MKNLSKYKNLIYLLFAGFVFRILAARYGTYQLDHQTFIAWGRSLNNLGYSSFYTSVWSDYLPGYLHVLKQLAYIEKFNLLDSVVLYKIPAILGDLFVAAVIYFAGKKFNKKLSLVAALIFLFNPAIFVNSTLWGQVDVFSALFTISSIFFINNPIFSAFLLAIGGSIKPQAAMVVPILLALMIHQKWKVNKIIAYGVLTSMIMLLIFLPFDNSNNVINFLLNRVSITMGQYPYGSVNAFNFWGLWGFWRPDNIGLFNHKTIGGLIVLFLSLLTFRKVLKNPDERYQALAYLLFINFMFLTRMHERHLLPAIVPLSIILFKDKFIKFVYFVLSATYLLNIYYAYQYISPDKSFVISDINIKFVILINLTIFVLWSLYFLFDKRFNLLKILEKFKTKDRKFSKDWFTDLETKKLLMLVLLFAFVSRILLLWHPNEYYFDEIYHEFTARQIIHGDNRPWDWMSSHPEGFAYEWTHPPLGKEIMAASMLVLGENHFAARLPGAILGVGVIYLTFLIAKKLTDRNDIAILSATFLSMDGLLFTMSRIATVDIYFLFFSLITLYFLLKENYYYSSVFLGLSLASKWSTLWLLPILLIAIYTQKLKLKKSLLFFLIIPIAIYLLSYLPMFMHGYDISHFWQMQKQMWWYHSGLVATHPYTSAWWTWPFNYRPVYLYQLDEGTGLLGNIYAMGNPFFFWSGLIAIIVSFYLLLKKQTPKVTAFVLYAYLAFFVPWALSPRIMFIYHYLPSLPFLAVILAIVSKSISKKFSLFFVVILFVSFLYFYPHWSGIPIPAEFSSKYYWIKSWR